MNRYSNSHAVGGDDAPGPANLVVGAKPCGLALDIAGCTRDAKLVLDWMCDSICTYDYFSCKLTNPEGNLVLSFFQLLSVPRWVTVVSTYDTDLDKQRLAWNVVELGNWSHSKLGDDSSWHEVFEVGDGTEVHLVSMLECDPAARQHFRIWKRYEGDVGAVLNSGIVALRSLTPT
jgi:hypothetical protein